MSDESLFREVDEEVRQDEYKKLWDRYGTALIALCVAVIAGVSAFKAYQYYQLRQAEADSILFIDGMKAAAAGKPEDAKRVLDRVQQKGFSQLGRFHEAGALAAAGKSKEAAQAFDDIAADASLDQSLRDAANIRAAYLLVDTAPVADIVARVGRFDKNDDPLRFQAREAIGLAAYRAGDFSTASQQANALFLDKDTPPDVRSRAQVLMQVIAPKVLNK